MTEKVNPSEFRPIEAFKTAGAIAYGGTGGEGFVVPSTSPTHISAQDSGIDETQLNEFTVTSSTSSFDVTIDGGEAFVFGAWTAIDTQTTVTLASGTANQTVYVGWDKDGTNNVIVGLDSAFATASGNTDERIPLWRFDTDANGVTNITDVRIIGFSQLIEGISVFDDDAPAIFGINHDFSISYNATSDELEVVDEINDTVKQSFDKSGDVHIPAGALNFRNSNNIQSSGTDAIALNNSQDVGIVNGDLTDGTNTIYDQSVGEIPDSAMGSISNSTLVNSSVTVAGNSVSLGSTATVDYVDLNDTGTSFPIPNADISNSSITVAGNSISLGGSSSINYVDLSDTGTSFPIPNTDLANSSITVNGNSVSLGGTATFSYVDLNDTGTSFPIPNADISNSSITVAGNSVSLGGSTTIDYVDLNDTGTSFPIPNSDLNNDNVTITTGTDVVGGGAVNLGGSITIDHADTSTQGNVTSATNSAVADINLDGRGHVTDINIESRSLDDWDDASNNIALGGNDVTDLGIISFRDRDGDGNNWRILEDAGDGKLRWDSVNGGGTKMDLEDDGNLRIAGEITETASL